MGLFSFIYDALIDYSASQGDTNAIEIARYRDELRERKRQKKEAKKRKNGITIIQEVTMIGTICISLLLTMMTMMKTMTMTTMTIETQVTTTGFPTRKAHFCLVKTKTPHLLPTFPTSDVTISP